MLRPFHTAEQLLHHVGGLFVCSFHEVAVHRQCDRRRTMTESAADREWVHTGQRTSVSMAEAVESHAANFDRLKCQSKLQADLVWTTDLSVPSGKKQIVS